MFPFSMSRFMASLLARSRSCPVIAAFLLWALGQDLPGAVTITPANGDVWPPEVAQSEDGTALDRDNILRFSLAGVQLKFSALESASGGLTIPASGMGGDWIVKLPSREDTGVPENEFPMMHLASLLGLDVPDIGLIDIDNISGLPEGMQRLGKTAFKIRRFDRQANGERVHMEDFAQVFSVYSDDKYKRASMRNIASVIASETNDRDIREFIRRLVFNTLIGNGDMHLKNWSLIYPDKRNAALAPAYDFVSTIAYIHGDSFALKYSRKREFADLDFDELSHLAAKATLPEKMVIDTAREMTAEFLSHWAREKKHLPMLEGVRTAIDELLPTLPLVTAVS
ncbi:type II toxin-antitoxin system HipA family toxin [Polycladidibacter stylochi]|uniref:type II toxin-antitoxin system HipA family toxin n=1 Tax=Polycladidibacter stylochi TaxID=1807766 RepID=UPI0009EC1F40|nr:HipA domain-containing protein [Pseudovibrio stylochi]